MPPIGYIARRAGRTAALSIMALAFLLSAGVLLTLAAFFLMAPIYGPGIAFLVLGSIHLALSLIFAAAIALGRRRYRVMAEATPAEPVYGSAMTGLVAAFVTGLMQGVAAGRERRERKRGAGHVD